MTRLATFVHDDAMVARINGHPFARGFWLDNASRAAAITRGKLRRGRRNSKQNTTFLGDTTGDYGDCSAFGTLLYNTFVPNRNHKNRAVFGTLDCNLFLTCVLINSYISECSVHKCELTVKNNAVKYTFGHLVK